MDENQKPKRKAGDKSNGAPALDAKQWAFVQTGLEHLDDGFSIYDADLDLVAWNSKFFELTDLPMEEFGYFGAPFEDFLRYNAERGEYGQYPVEDIIKDKVAEARKFKPHVFERERPNGMVLEVRGQPYARWRLCNGI